MQAGATQFRQPSSHCGLAAQSSWWCLPQAREGWRRYFTRKQASFDAIARNCTPENEAYKRRLGTPFDHSFDRNIGAIKCATIRDAPLSFERAKGCEGAQAGQWRHIFQAKPAATRPQLKHLTSLREMPGQHPGMTISDNRSDTCWVEMLGKKTLGELPARKSLGAASSRRW